LLSKKRKMPDAARKETHGKKGKERKGKGKGKGERAYREM